MDVCQIPSGNIFEDTMKSLLNYNEIFETFFPGRDSTNKGRGFLVQKSLISLLSSAEFLIYIQTYKKYFNSIIHHIGIPKHIVEAHS
jgi:hypothetical protein